MTFWGEASIRNRRHTRWSYYHLTLCQLSYSAMLEAEPGLEPGTFKMSHHYKMRRLTLC